MIQARRLVGLHTQLSRLIATSSQRLIDVPSSKPLSEERQQELDSGKKRLEWRQNPHEKEWQSSFKGFLEDDDPSKTKESFFARWSRPIDFSPSSVKRWFKLNLEKKERYLQQYIPERHQILGNDLAAAHFLVFRGAKVRFVGEPNWVQMDRDGRYNLPDRYVHGLFVEDIDCEGTKIFYEGLENLRRLKSLKTASFKDMKCFDDWSADRISGSEFEALELLDLSGTSITHRGLQALYRIPSLKKLILTDPYRDTEMKLVLAMLQDIMPALEIVEVHEPLKLEKSEQS